MHFDNESKPCERCGEFHWIANGERFCSGCREPTKKSSKRSDTPQREVIGWSGGHPIWSQPPSEPWQ